MQDKLPDGYTVVPIILASDKTHLSRMHGDQNAWPVYITIRNLQRDARRAHSRPGMAILGMTPIVAEKEVKAQVYHYALGLITQGKLSCPRGILSADQDIQQSKNTPNMVSTYNARTA